MEPASSVVGNYVLNHYITLELSYIGCTKKVTYEKRGKFVKS